MGNMHLVTGYAGQPHVSASDQGSFVEAFIRSGEFVLEAGAKFAASIVTNNQIRVNDGEMMMQGRHVKLNPGSYVDLTIENGSQGYRRSDLVVVRYTRNPDSGIEECNLVVLKGTPAESNPADPQYITGIINAEGALQHDFPLYRVSLSGLVLEGLTSLFDPQKSLFDSLLRLIGGTMAGNIAMGGHKVTGLGTPTANGDAVPLKYAKDNFAPSGFGLGEAEARSCTDCNSLELLKSGWYRWHDVCENAPFLYGVMRVDSRGSESVQTAYCITGSNIGLCAQRIMLKSATPAEWEWVNPPMRAGIEYRTTERYKGSVVYKKVDTNGDVLWRIEGDTKWRLLTAASYVTAATVE